MSSHVILHVYFCDEDQQPTDAPIVLPGDINKGLLEVAVGLPEDQPQRIAHVEIEYR